MEQHKYILASDTRDLLGNWTEPNIIEVQSLPDTGNGARGIAVQGVGMTSKQKEGATRNKGGPQQSALMEHFTQHHGSVAAAQVMVAHQMHQATQDPSDTDMINTLRPAKTKLGKARVRMKWTTEVNEYILRTYYLITQLETNCKHYRDTLHKLFSEEFPDVEVCAQRIADQRRAIVKNHLLTQERIEEIRRDVELDLAGTGGLPSAPTQHQQQQQQQQQPQRTVALSATSSGAGPIIVSSPIMTMSKEHPSTMTVWYGCVKEEQQDTDGPYHTAGPSGHKLRKLSHGHSLSGGGGSHQPQHIIIHTTSAAAAAAALGVGPHTITSAADALKR